MSDKIKKKLVELPEKLLETNYELTIDQLIGIVDKYRERTFTEELNVALELGGVEALGDLLKTDLNRGLLESDDTAARIEMYGSNKRPEAKRQSLCEHLWEAFGDLILRILAFLGLLSLIIGATLGEKEKDWIEGFAIILAVMIVVFVTGFNDYRKGVKFATMQQSYKNRQSITVIRNEVICQIHPSEILVGEIVILSDGNIVPGDGIIISADKLEVDESALTGENDKMKKASLEECLSLRDAYIRKHPDYQEIQGEVIHHEIPSPICISGTTLAEGRGKMLVLSVGKNSVEGRIMEISEQEESATPLQKKLDKIASDISKMGMACAIFAVVVLFLRFGIEIGIGTVEWETGDGIQEIIDYILVGITVLVVAIPEGLPLAVTISLAYSVMKMQKQQNLVKRMHACETMGGANMICSDKTGTLTTNDMTVAAVVIGTDFVDLARKGLNARTFVPEYLALLKEAICVNSTAFMTQDPENPKKLKETGSKTELSMLKMLIELGHGDYIEVRNQYIKRVHKLFPFSSSRKRSSIVITLSDGSQRAHIKGASEVILSLCTGMVTSDGQNVEEMDDETKSRVLDIINEANSKGMRTICLAYREVNDPSILEEEDEEGHPVIESSELIYIGIIGIRDPVRAEVPGAVALCNKAGIRVRMVTGDNEITARAIAKDCKIILKDDSSRVIKGPDFYEKIGGVVCKLCQTRVCECPRNSKEAEAKKKELREDVVGNLEEFKRIVEDIDVMARSRPEDKYALVTGLIQLGNIVAVTGDGTNDAPALRKASIGFAMGIAGTELAKETADIILLDDNFSSIVNAVKWGRNIYDNIRKFIQFQVTVNIVAVTCAIVGAVTIKQSPLTAIQMLWVNLIMDTFASLALATEEPTDQLLERKPHRGDEYIVSRKMWKHILGQAIIQLIIIFVLMYAGEKFLPELEEGSRILHNPETGDTVRSGRMYHVDGSVDYKDHYDDSQIGPSRHFTYIFNIFVMLQIFNEFNARRINDELNVFEGLKTSYMFILISILVLGLQVIMVSVGSYAFSVHMEGLTWYQWLLCIAFGLLPLPWRLVLRKIPDHLFKEYGDKELDLAQESPGPLVIKRSSQSLQKRHSSVQPH